MPLLVSGNTELFSRDDTLSVVWNLYFVLEAPADTRVQVALLAVCLPLRLAVLLLTACLCF